MIGNDSELSAIQEISKMTNGFIHSQTLELLGTVSLLRSTLLPGKERDRKNLTSSPHG